MIIILKLRNIFYYEKNCNIYTSELRDLPYFLNKTFFTLCLINYIEDYHVGNQCITDILLYNKNQYGDDIHFFQTRKRYNKKLIKNIVKYVVCELDDYTYYENELPDSLKDYDLTIGYIESLNLSDIDFGTIPDSIVKSKKFSKYVASRLIKEFLDNNEYKILLNRKFFKKLTITI
jgi:hypothetical protein